MKKTDIAMIIFIAGLSILLAYFVAKSVLGDVSEESVKVKTADPISAQVTEPDSTVFNKDAINPTVKVVIGEKNGSE